MTFFSFYVLLLFCFFFFGIFGIYKFKVYVVCNNLHFVVSLRIGHELVV